MSTRHYEVRLETQNKEESEIIYLEDKQAAADITGQLQFRPMV